MPLSIREYYWPFRDDITMQDGVVFKAHRVIIPKSMRKKMLNRIHSPQPNALHIHSPLHMLMLGNGLGNEGGMLGNAW